MNKTAVFDVVYSVYSVFLFLCFSCTLSLEERLSRGHSDHRQCVVGVSSDATKLREVELYANEQRHSIGLPVGLKTLDVIRLL